MDYYRNLNASSLDPDFPTFFELLASRQLGDLINPYLRYIIVHYAQRHPQYLLKLATRFDELYAVIFGLVEFGYLRHWNSSFVEKFYGLKRVNQLPVQAPLTMRAAPKKVEPLRRLKRKQVIGAVFFAVGVPYLREKLQHRYETLAARYELRSAESYRPAADAPLIDHWKFQFDTFLFEWFPRVVFVGNGIDLLLAALYLFKGTGAYTLADLVLDTRYSRISAGDYERHESVLTRGRFKTAKRALGALGYVLPATLFGIKFLEWWNTSQLASKLASAGSGLSPPQFKNERWTGCPICKSSDPKTPVVLETGVICCFECVEGYARSIPESVAPKCPATNIILLQVDFNSELRRWELGGVRRLIT